MLFLRALRYKTPRLHTHSTCQTFFYLNVSQFAFAFSPPASKCVLGALKSHSGIILGGLRAQAWQSAGCDSLLCHVSCLSACRLPLQSAQQQPFFDYLSVGRPSTEPSNTPQKLHSWSIPVTTSTRAFQKRISEAKSKQFMTVWSQSPWLQQGLFGRKKNVLLK